MLTKADILLFAAKKLPALFTVEDLVVESWKLNKPKFGLKGFSDTYPDNNKVLTVLMGREGLVKKGKLVKTGNQLKLGKA